MSEWSTERIAEQFRRDIQKRFEAENAEWLAEERAQIAKIEAEHNVKHIPHRDWLTVRNSYYWEIYNTSVITIRSNAVRVVLPDHFAIYPDFIAMFGNTSVGWTVPSVSPLIVDGRARLAIELLLIDGWDDERHAQWLAENPDA